MMAFIKPMHAMAACWGLLALVFASVVIRFYTRIRYVTTYGLDDYLFVCSFVRTLLAPCL